MDPNEALRCLRIAIKRAEYKHDSEDGIVTSLEMDFCNYAAALHGWLTNGGFLPAAWDKGRK